MKNIITKYTVINNSAMQFVAVFSVVVSITFTIPAYAQFMPFKGSCIDPAVFSEVVFDLIDSGSDVHVYEAQLEDLVKGPLVLIRSLSQNIENYANLNFLGKEYIRSNVVELAERNIPIVLANSIEDCHKTSLQSVIRDRNNETAIYFQKKVYELTGVRFSRAPVLIMSPRITEVSIIHDAFVIEDMESGRLVAFEEDVAEMMFRYRVSAFPEALMLARSGLSFVAETSSYHRQFNYIKENNVTVDPSETYLNSFYDVNMGALSRVGLIAPDLNRLIGLLRQKTRDGESTKYQDFAEVFCRVIEYYVTGDLSADYLNYYLSSCHISDLRYKEDKVVYLGDIVRPYFKLHGDEVSEVCKEAYESAESDYELDREYFYSLIMDLSHFAYQHALPFKEIDQDCFLKLQPLLIGIEDHFLELAQDYGIIESKIANIWRSL